MVSTIPLDEEEEEEEEEEQSTSLASPVVDNVVFIFVNVGTVALPIAAPDPVASSAVVTVTSAHRRRRSVTAAHRPAGTVTDSDDSEANDPKPRRSDSFLAPAGLTEEDEDVDEDASGAI